MGLPKFVAHACRLDKSGHPDLEQQLAFTAIRRT